MSPADGSDGAERDYSTKLSFGQRLLLVLPSFGKKKQKAPIGDWARKTFLKPEDPDSKSTPKASDTPESVEELEVLVKSLTEKERGIGLIAAPLAAAIGFVVVHTLIANDPAQYLKGGALNSHYVNPSLYHDVLIVLLVLALAMLTTALLRRRLFLGMATALYGLAVFNLHYWGFGVPFVLAGAWYLVRAYRLQRSLREANGEGPRYGSGSRSRGGTPSNGNRPGANKRYTPRPSPSSRAVRPKRTN